MKYLTKTACLLPLFIGLLFSFSVVAQTTLYSEDFSSQNGKGAAGSSTDLTGVNWSIDLTNATLSATSDWFQVVNGVFEGRDVDGTQQSNGGGDGPVWISPSISISGYTNVSISISASESGTMERQDFVRASYQIDGGTITQFAQEIDDFGSVTLQTSGLSGSSLVVYVEMDNNSGSEYIRFDDVLVQGTPANTNDTDTEIYETGSPVAGATITAANATTSGNAVDVFNFTIEDQGSGDGLATDVTQIVIKPASTNTADWTDHIQGIVLDDGSNFITPASSPVITDTEITIPITSGDIEVADGGSVDVTLAVYLNTSNIVDGAIMAFEIPASGFDFTSDASGSGFTNSLLLGAITGNDFTIDIDATELQFTTQPVNSSVSTVITQVDVAYTDVNGNVDTDYDGSGFDIQLTTTGTFDGSATTTVEASNGVSAFSNLIFSATGTGLTLTATDQSGLGIGSVVSNTFDVTNAPVYCGSESFDNSNASSSYSNGSFTGDNGVTWTYTQSRNDAGYEINGEGLMLRRSASSSKVVSSSVSGGISEFTCSLLKAFTGSGNRQVELYVNGVSQGTSLAWDNTSVQTFTVSDINISGDVIIEIRNITSKQVIVDDISWTCYSPSPMEYTGGSWSSTPDGSTGAIDAIVRASETLTISSSFSVNDFEVESGATVTISSGTVTINGDITNNGTINVSDGTSILQTISTDNNSGSGTYNVTRSSGTLSNDTWYQYWSSSVSGETMGDVFTGSNTNDFYSFDGSWTSETSGTTMTPGVGYATTGTVGISGGAESRTFSGDVNNGNVTVNSSVGNAAYTLVGNPYPSALSAATFLTDNSGQIEGTLWFWDHHTNESGGDNDAGDYATWNGSGGAGNSGDAPNGNIGTAQGFFVQAAAGTPTITFNNAQRISGNNDKFYKTNNVEQRKRAWLTLTNENNDANQILVAFLPQATDGYDNFYDGKKFKAHPRLAFYSLMNDEEFAIQGLPWLGLNKSKEIPLGVDAWVTGNMTIALDSLSNWPNNYSISLEDRLLGTSIDLKDASTYSFVVDAVGTIQNRFYLHVCNAVKEGGSIENPSDKGSEEVDNPTGTEELQANQLTIFRSGEELVVSSDLSQVDQITVFDVSGRIVFDKTLTSNMIRIPWSSKGVFIVSVLTSEGNQHTAKVNF
jgi:hypothetical protein